MTAIFGPEMLADPRPTYHKLRAAAPVYWAAPLDAWVVTSHEAVSAGLRDPRLSSDRAGRVKQRLAAKGLDHLVEDRMVSMLHKDAPDHTRLRGLRLDGDAPAYRNSFNLRGLKTLRVTW